MFVFLLCWDINRNFNKVILLSLEFNENWYFIIIIKLMENIKYRSEYMGKKGKKDENGLLVDFDII